MMCFPRAPLTASGLLRLDSTDGEVELMRRDGMELRSDSVEPMMPLKPSDGSWVDRNTDLTVTVTTHRLVFAKQKQARFLHLSNVHQVETAGASRVMAALKSPKIALNTYVGDLLLVFRSTSTNTSTATDRDDMLQILQKALERRAWERASRLQAKQHTSSNVVKRKVGVDAILTKNALRHKEAAKLTDQAFEGDAETLLTEASELVAIIQKYVRTLESQSTEKQEDASRLNDMLQDMGMTSALSRHDHRGDYYDTLARQLADFLRPKLKTAGGLMTLTDVYCYFNRARGTNLISPEDLLQAMECMKDLKLGMSQRDFPSGVRVVQEDAFDDTVMAQRLEALADTSGITALDAGRALHISALLANEQLLSAERMGYICRDNTLETIRFFPNRFRDFTWR